MNQIHNPVISADQTPSILELLSNELLPNASDVIQEAIKKGSITTGTIITILPRSVTNDRAKLAKVIGNLSGVFHKVNVSIIVGSAEKPAVKKQEQAPILPLIRKEVTALRDVLEDPEVDYKQLTPGPVIEVEQYHLESNQDIPHEELRVDVTDKTWFGFYLRMVRQYPLLDETKETELGKAALDGDIAARNTLVLHNMRLALKIARDFINRGVDFEDLVQEANIGLITAAEKFNPEKGRFSTYATWWVRQRVQNYIRDNKSVIRYPAHIQEQRWQLRKIEKELVIALGREPTKQELKEKARHLANLDQVLLMIQSTITHLDSTIDHQDGESSIHDVVADMVIADAMLNLDAKERLDHSSQRIRKFVAAVKALDINDRDKEFFLIYYGLSGHPEGATLESTAQSSGVTCARVRQIIVAVWGKLQELNVPFDDRTLAEELHKVYELEMLTSVEAELIPSNEDLLVATENQLEEINPGKGLFDRIIKGVASIVAQVTHVDVADIFRESGDKQNILARSVALFALRFDFSFQLSEIGRLTGINDHSQVYAICKRFEEESQRKAELMEILCSIRTHYTLTWYNNVAEILERQKILFPRQINEARMRVCSSQVGGDHEEILILRDMLAKSGE